MKKHVSLDVAELDDAFHHAVYLCDAAIEQALRGAMIQCEMLVSDVDAQVLNRLIDNARHRLEKSFHDIEQKHMGKERYDAMMERILAKREFPRKPQ